LADRLEDAPALEGAEQARGDMRVEGVDVSF